MSAKYRGLKRSLQDFRLHPWLHLVTISTITVALLILGGFFLCYRNFENIAEKTSPNITGTAYLKEGTSIPTVEALKEKILSLENVTKITYKSKTHVAQELQAFLGESPTEVLPGSELFPDVLELELKKETSSAAISMLKSILARYPEISEVDFSEDWLAQYKKVRQLLTWAGIGLMIALVIGCGFLIANVMSMRHQSRKEEIEIVHLIGAHQNFVLTPLIWEGIIEGLFGASLAILLLYIGKICTGSILSLQWASLTGMREWLFLSPWQLVGVLFLGVTMALIGGVTVFLRLQEKYS